MGKFRDWAKDVENTEIEFLGKEGNYIYCAMDGFTFRVVRTSWPPKRLTPDSCTTPTEFFKFQVTKVHGDLYDLGPTVYEYADNPVKAICKIHGEFQVLAKNFKTTRGCPFCGLESIGNMTADTTEQFIEKAKAVHGTKYDYGLVEYKNSHSKVYIGCLEHGIFNQKPYNHLMGKGCLLCGRINSKLSRVLSLEEVLDRFYSVHGDLYDYNLVDYEGDAHGLLNIVCREHGPFTQSYANHYHSKSGCPGCAKEFSPRLRKGFVRSSNSKDGYASLYLINCFDDDENFYKIGITTKSVKQRFSGKEAMPYYFTVEFLLLGDAEWLWDLEKLLHREYKLHKYLPEKEFGGRYECFSHIDLDEYTKLLHTVA